MGFFSFFLYFTSSLSRNIFLLLLESALINLSNVLTVCDFFLAAIGISFTFSEDGLNFVVQTTSAVTNIQNLKSLFNCDASLELLVVHEELN